VCNREQFRRLVLKYSRRVTAIDRIDAAERLARIEQTIEEYRAGTERRLMQRAIKLSRRAKACQKLVALETQPERIH